MSREQEAIALLRVVSKAYIMRLWKLIVRGMHLLKSCDLFGNDPTMLN